MPLEITTGLPKQSAVTITASVPGNPMPPTVNGTGFLPAGWSQPRSPAAANGTL